MKSAQDDFKIRDDNNPVIRFRKWGSNLLTSDFAHQHKGAVLEYCTLVVFPATASDQQMQLSLPYHVHTLQFLRSPKVFEVQFSSLENVLDVNLELHTWVEGESFDPRRGCFGAPTTLWSLCQSFKAFSGQDRLVPILALLSL